MARAKKTDTIFSAFGSRKHRGRNRKEAFFHLVRKWFLTGLLAVAPVGITVALITVIVSFADNLVIHLLPQGYEPAVLFGHEVPGLGLITTLLTVTIIGALVSNFFGRYFIRIWDNMVGRVPVISGVYGAVKQVLTSVLSEQGSSFREVVYIEFPQPGQYIMGFVIGPVDHFPSEILEKQKEPMISVFIPMVPMPTSGYLIALPESKLIKTNIAVEEGLKLTVTLGLVKKNEPVDAVAAVILPGVK